MIRHTFSPEEVRDLHNGKCELRFAIQSIEQVLAEKHTARLNKALSLIDKAMSSMYEEEERQLREADKVHDHLRTTHQLSSLWSISEVRDFSEVPFPNATSLVYKNNWGKHVECALPNNPTWLDLWKAADTLIKLSGDSHHVFIENFIPENGNLTVLELSTGS